MVGYNLTNIATNTTSYLGMMKGVNDTLMLGWLFTLLLMGLGVVLFTSMLWSTGNVVRSMTSTTTVVAFLSIILGAMQLVNPLTVFICVIFAALSIAFSWGRD